MCKECNRQFALDPIKSPIPDSTKELIDRLLLERIPLAGIARSVKVSETWLQDYVNKKYLSVPRHVSVPAQASHHLAIECDELWSFVENKDNKQWVWLAKDRNTQYIVGVYIGSRGIEGAQGLWNSLPSEYQEKAICYTDFWESYKSVFPDQHHRPVGKESGQTNPIERFNCTLRQRISRLVRKALSFSKKLDNHIGAIWYFIHHYNSEISAKAFT
jgi:insertion element IS1 protein InsB